MKQGDAVSVEVMPQGKLLRARPGERLQDLLLECGVEFPCGGLGRCRACRVRVIAGDIDITPAMSSCFTEAELMDGWRLACQGRVNGDVRIEAGAGDMPILADGSVLGAGSRSGLGVAVDLGTTTIVAELIDLASGSVLDVRSSLNPQSAFGSDVMSRINFALGSDSLTPLIRAHVGGMVQSIARGRNITDVVIVGNTAMRQIFCGFDVQPLSSAPFIVPSLAGTSFTPAELGWHLGVHCTVRFLRCIGGFVGSDILAGILACDMPRAQAPCALVDLGTNGEIVVGCNGRLVCASTAAGPAFEAASISRGMRATTGAIHHVLVDRGEIRCEVIGGGPARGICGSGLVDAASAGLNLGVIQPSGRLTNGDFVLTPEVGLQQRDIRELQLAKGAIAAGLRLLTARLGLTSGQLSNVYLAGAFGNYVRVPSASRIGLLEVADEIVTPVGNAALRGAKMVLLGTAGPDDISCEHISLAEDPAFQDTFAESLTFPSASQALI